MHHYLCLLVYIFIGQAICGVLLFEWAWKRIERQRSIDEDRDANFPAYRRVDKHLWSRWKFYPGAILVLMPTFVLGVTGLAWTYITHHICYFGTTWEKPLTGLRRKLFIW